MESVLLERGLLLRDWASAVRRQRMPGAVLPDDQGSLASGYGQGCRDTRPACGRAPSRLQAEGPALCLRTGRTALQWQQDLSADDGRYVQYYDDQPAGLGYLHSLWHGRAFQDGRQVQR